MHCESRVTAAADRLSANPSRPGTNAHATCRLWRALRPQLTGEWIHSSVQCHAGFANVFTEPFSRESLTAMVTMRHAIEHVVTPFGHEQREVQPLRHGRDACVYGYGPDLDYESTVHPVRKPLHVCKMSAASSRGCLQPQARHRPATGAAQGTMHDFPDLYYACRRTLCTECILRRARRAVLRSFQRCAGLLAVPRKLLASCASNLRRTPIVTPRACWP